MREGGRKIAREGGGEIVREGGGEIARETGRRGNCERGRGEGSVRGGEARKKATATRTDDNLLPSLHEHIFYLKISTPPPGLYPGIKIIKI